MSQAVSEVVRVVQLEPQVTACCLYTDVMLMATREGMEVYCLSEQECRTS